jgi:polyisoprenoid-binding protein YceI
VASVETGERNRDTALQPQEYLDAARYPALRFVSDRVRSSGPLQLAVQGRIAIRGMTRPPSASR